MSITTTTHLNFRGNAREALDFYAAVFGGEVVAFPHPDDPDHVMWGQAAAPNGFRVMAYDVPADRPWSAGDDPFFISVRGTDADELARRWEALIEGGTVKQPLGPAGWSPLYGMVTDRFGVTWVLDLETPQQ